VDHTVFDKRKYPIVEVPQGYGEWVRTYEQTVHDEMDLRLLERLQSVDWSGRRSVLDLACGTGRIGAWLSARCPAPVDGVDLTPEMLEIARGRWGDFTKRWLASPGAKVASSWSVFIRIS
jgi:ubiquinone/menaquinone biosynthesis C-methylase UbiE